MKQRIIRGRSISPRTSPELSCVGCYFHFHFKQMPKGFVWCIKVEAKVPDQRCSYYETHVQHWSRVARQLDDYLR